MKCAKEYLKNHIKKQIEKHREANEKKGDGDGDLIKVESEAEAETETEAGDTINCAYNFVFILSISNSFNAEKSNNNKRK